jgi:hypothetical protein
VQEEINEDEQPNKLNSIALKFKIGSTAIAVVLI